MAYARRNSTSTEGLPDTLENRLLAAESAWREAGTPRWNFVAYEVRGETVYEIHVPTPQAFSFVRAAMKFLKAPSHGHAYVKDERGRNANQYWNDLEMNVAHYNVASVGQGLVWFAGTDKHSLMPDHRRQPLERQPRQPPPFPESIMSPDGLHVSAHERGSEERTRQPFDAREQARALGEKMRIDYPEQQEEDAA